MNRAPQSQRTYFLTFVAANRRRVFQVDATARLMCSTLAHYRAGDKFALHAFVVMQDHVHVLLTPAETVALERVVQLIKGGFSFRLKSKLEVWQSGHFGKRIADRDGYDECVRYIEDNPVRKRMVSEASEYPYSSASLPNVVDACPAWFM